MAEWMISSGILILLVIGVRRLMKNRISPLLQYALWLIVLVRLLLPFNLVNSGISVMNMVKPVEKVIVLTQSGTDQGLEVLPSTSSAGTENALDFAATSQAQASEHTISLDFALRAAWLMGAAAILIIAAVINIRFSRHLQKHRSWLPGQPIRTYVVSGISSPCLYGIISPAIYITQDVAQDMTALQHVIAHEQAHYRHGDHIWSKVLKVPQDVDNLSLVEQRGKFTTGEELMLLPVRGEEIAFQVEQILDESGNKQDSAPHAQQKLWVRLPKEASEGAILVKKRQ